jgi:hypothetical protein
MYQKNINIYKAGTKRISTESKKKLWTDQTHVSGPPDDGDNYDIENFKLNMFFACCRVAFLASEDPAIASKQ